VTIRLPVPIYSDKNLQPIVQEMKSWAQSGFVVKVPAYSTSEEKAIAMANANPEKAFQDVWRLMFMPDRFPVTIALSIDAYEANKVWHLSMSKPNYQTQRPERVPDSFARRVVKAFGLEMTEGPTEGVFKKVRHFRAPYRPE
jgi:hypothetical protein